MSINERRQREKDERIQRIETAAIGLFSRRGYKETTMDDIAREAELGKGTLYYYFPTKEDIFWSLFQKITKNFYQGILTTIRDDQTLTGFIEEMLFYYIDWFSARPDELHIIFPLGKNSPLGDGIPVSDNRFLDHRQPLEEQLTRLAEKDSVPIDGSRFSRLIWNFLMGISFQLVRGTHPDVIKNDTALFIALLANNLTTLGGTLEKTV